MRTSILDSALEDADGVVRWEEHIYGGKAHCMLDGRHLAKVLRARPAYFANKPKLRYTAPTLRLVKPAKAEKSA